MASMPYAHVESCTVAVQSAAGFWLLGCLFIASQGCGGVVDWCRVLGSGLGPAVDVQPSFFLSGVLVSVCLSVQLSFF